MLVVSVGVVVGAVLGFVASLVDARLRRQRRGRAAARLIWLELMVSRGSSERYEKSGIPSS